LNHTCKIFILSIVLALIPISAFAQRPVIQAVKISEPPKIDGDLSDACWQKAPKVEDFFIMTDGSKPAEKTESWICYDKKNIYAAFRCTDSKPEGIVAQQTKRGGNMNNDDLVALLIDCFNNCEQVIEVDVSANGTQCERLQSGDVSKIEWRGDWIGVAKRTPTGYNVEIALPWSILQYDPKGTKMGVMFGRKHMRTAKTWIAPNCGVNADPKLFYVWDGLKLPDYKKKPLVLAYSTVTSGQGSTAAQVGLDIKKSFTPKLTGVLSINPDFRDIEQQVASTDFSYTEKYLSDARPFFQEGSGYFPGHTLFYTRRIEGIDYGAKFMGKMGDYSVGVMQVQGADNNAYDALGFGRQWDDKGHLALYAVDSRIPGTDNLASKLEGDIKLYNKNQQVIDLTGSYFEANSASGNGIGNSYELALNAWGRPRTLGWYIDRRMVGANFDPLIGYVPEKDISMWSGGWNIYDEPAKGVLRNCSAGMDVNAEDHLDGSLFHNDFDVNFSCSFRNDTGVNLGWSTSDRPPFHDSVTCLGYSWAQRSIYRNGGITYTFGKEAGGDYASYTLCQSWNLSKKLTVNAGYNVSRLSEPSPDAFHAAQLVGTFAYDFDKEHTVTGRLVSQMGRNNAYFSYCQRVRSGMDIYLLYGDPNALSTVKSVTLKLVRPL